MSRHIVRVLTEIICMIVPSALVLYAVCAVLWGL